MSQQIVCEKCGRLDTRPDLQKAQSWRGETTGLAQGVRQTVLNIHCGLDLDALGAVVELAGAILDLEELVKALARKPQSTLRGDDSP